MLKHGCTVEDSALGKVAMFLAIKQRAEGQAEVISI